MRCLENVRYPDSVETNDVGPSDGKHVVETNHDGSWLALRARASDGPLGLSRNHLFQHEIVEVPPYKKLFEASVFLFELA